MSLPQAPISSNQSVHFKRRSLFFLSLWIGDTYTKRAADLSLNLECSLIGYYAICSLHCLILMLGTDLRICN